MRMAKARHVFGIPRQRECMQHCHHHDNGVKWQKPTHDAHTQTRIRTRTPSLPYTRKKQRVARTTGQRPFSIKVQRSSDVAGTQKTKKCKTRARCSKPSDGDANTHKRPQIPTGTSPCACATPCLSRVTPLPAALPLPQLYRQLCQCLLEGGVRPYARHVLCGTPLLLWRDVNRLQPALVHTHQAY